MLRPQLVSDVGFPKGIQSHFYLKILQFDVYVLYFQLSCKIKYKFIMGRVIFKLISCVALIFSQKTSR